LSHAHPVFDLGEGLLDRVEVGAVGREKPEAGTGGRDGLADGAGFVAAEIVHDDDIARPEHRHPLLANIGAEALAIDRAVEDAGRGEPVTAQGCQKGQGAPVTVWRETAQSLAFRPPAPQRHHVGLDPGLVNEHQAVGIEPALPGQPAPAFASDIPPAPFKGEQRFF
jgi:hypothetical protein